MRLVMIAFSCMSPIEESLQEKDESEVLECIVGVSILLEQNQLILLEL